MIPRAYITEWRAVAPWSQDAWVEQDLVISRALVALFSVAALAERLAFRGGTALYKLHLRPPARYSEDIDLVQFEMNLHEKARSPGFRRDILPLLRPDPSRDFDIDRGTGHRAGSAHQDAAGRTVAGSQALIRSCRRSCTVPSAVRRVLVHAFPAKKNLRGRRDRKRGGEARCLYRGPVEQHSPGGAR